MHPKIATRSDWKTKPMLELRIQLQVEEVFTKEEYKYLSWGLIPVSMDDKWFFYIEKDWLYIHRSWTGFCIFQVRLERFEDGYQIAEAWFNDDPEQRYDKFVLLWIGFLIRQNQEKDYCLAKVIIAFFICIFIQNISENANLLKSNFLVFIIDFICYLGSNDKLNCWSFNSNLYDFVDYFYIVILDES